MGERGRERTAYTVLSDPSDYRERECNVALAYFNIFLLLNISFYKFSSS